MLFGIALIILGILAAPSLLLSKKPNAQELLDKITPYQGWIGIIACFYGIWGIIYAIMNLGWLTSAPIWWITLLAVNVVLASLGFILGYGMISKHLLSKNEDAKEKGAQLLAKLRPLQAKLGLAGIVLGIWAIIKSIL